MRFIFLICKGIEVTVYIIMMMPYTCFGSFIFTEFNIT